MNSSGVNNLAGALGLTVCYGPTVVALNTPSGRFRFRVLDIIHARKQPQHTLRGANSEQWVSMKLKGKRGLGLDEAYEIAEALKYPLSELVSAPDSAIYELNSLEQQLIDAFRRMTDGERKSAVELLTMRQRAEPNRGGRRVASKRPQGAAHGGVTAARGSGIADTLRRDTEDFEAAVDATLAGQQAPDARPARPATPGSHRTPHRPDAKKIGR